MKIMTEDTGGSYKTGTRLETCGNQRTCMDSGTTGPRVPPQTSWQEGQRRQTFPEKCLPQRQQRYSWDLPCVLQARNEHTRMTAVVIVLTISQHRTDSLPQKIQILETGVGLKSMGFQAFCWFYKMSKHAAGFRYYPIFRSFGAAYVDSLVTVFGKMKGNFVNKN